MNKVYLSGEVYDEPVMVNRPDAAPHAVFSLMVSHRSKAGVQQELYRVSAWNRCAEYCGQRLKRGMRIALQGHLSLRPIQLETKLFRAVEVTMTEVFMPALPGAEIDESTGFQDIEADPGDTPADALQ